uniref:Arsenic transactivated protein 1 n=1 Tax=Homo sapiens TaxID=9606 RepID=Q695H4_HUMAN|nr:arsenic-like protein [synthetic construct]AAT80771.1 arsenic transactivated protein 1 [Homo sapiens]
MKIKCYTQCLSTTVCGAERPFLGLNSQFEALLFKDLPSGSDKKKHNPYLLHSSGLHTLPSLINGHFSISLLILREGHHGI